MKKLKITLVKSLQKRLKNHKDCVRGLGLRCIGDTKLVVASSENRGMVDMVRYMLRVEEVNE